MMRRAFFLVLAGAVLILTPVAQASPPDQSWIAGLYDNADYDDAVLAVTAALASFEWEPLPATRTVDTVVAMVFQIDESQHPTPSLSLNHTRAPPA